MVKTTVKHGGGSVMVLGCISAFRARDLVFIDSTTTKEVYLRILKESLHKSAEKVGILQLYKFYQDNDPKHSAFVVKEWLLYNCLKVIKTLEQTPNLNPIENL